MRNIKKTFVSAVSSLCLGTFVSVTGAQSQNVVQPVHVDERNAILIKISNISPIKDKEGFIKSCEFDTTFYNRTDNLVNNAKVELRWQDAAIGSVIEEEKRLAAEAAREEIEAPKRRRAGAVVAGGGGASATAQTTSEEVVLLLDVPTIEADKQVIVRNTIQTDRCFLLIGEASITVRDCSLSAPQQPAPEVRGRVAMPTSSASGAGCAGMFKHVSPKDAQFYKAFKKLTINEQRALEMSAQQRIKQEIEDEYQRVLSTLNETSEILKTIR